MYQSKITLEEEQRLNKALSLLDLTPIKVKMIKSKNWTPEYTEEVEKWYKRFLFLSHKYMGLPIVVNDIIDEFWHNHILDTRKYFEDCNNTFKYYLHHFPYFGMRSEQDRNDLQKAFETTNFLFLQEFGETEMRTDKFANNLIATNDEHAFFQAASCSDCTSDPPSLSYTGVITDKAGLIDFNYERPIK